MKIVFVIRFLFIWSVQPFLIIIRIIILTLLYSLLVYYFIKRYWYAYMLVLVIIRGVLVLFSYFIRLISNVKFELLSFVYIRIFLFFVFLFKINKDVFFIDDFSFISFKFWERIIGLYNIYLVLFLLIIIVMVVWLRNLNIGAVRNF